MTAFRSLVFAAALAGMVAGVLVTLVQAVGTTPLIFAAEAYEQAAPVHEHGGAEAWAPADGVERTGYTLLANLVTSIGFALLLVAGMALAGRRVGWREGLLWGLAGFAAFALAPSLGLPPEPPGAAAAGLGARQAWWAMTVAATAGGLALLAFGRAPLVAVAAVALLATPHLIGAPQPSDGAASLAPEALAHRFATVVIVTSLLFWAALGVLSALFFNRFGRSSAA